MIYLDNAATTHPKPEAVYRAADEALRAGGNPGRGGHRLALAAGRRVLAARESISALLGLPDSGRLLFTGSTTDSLNLALKGMLRAGDHVITTDAEHNALRRPLTALERLGVYVTRVPVSPEGILDPADVAEAILPSTRVIAVAHASNVTGAIQPVADLGEIARRAGILLLVDAAQTAGNHPLHAERMGIHLLAAPGHKGLLGPQGTGILWADPKAALRPIREGGTGYLSAQAEQPDIFPEGFESGTLNVPGIAGLCGGAEFLLAEGVERVMQHERRLTGLLMEGLRRIPGLTLYGPAEPERRAAVVSFNLAGLDPAELEERLDEEYGVIGRAGLHCNPGAHRCQGSLELGGAMRLSPGYFTTEAYVLSAVAAVAEIAASLAT